jgi:hypothetical protein
MPEKLRFQIRVYYLVKGSCYFLQLFLYKMSSDTTQCRGWAGLGSGCMMRLFTQNIADDLTRILSLEPSTTRHIMLFTEWNAPPPPPPKKKHTQKMKSTIFRTCDTTQWFTHVRRPHFEGVWNFTFATSSCSFNWDSPLESIYVFLGKKNVTKSEKTSNTFKAFNEPAPPYWYHSKNPQISFKLFLNLTNIPCFTLNSVACAVGPCVEPITK